MAAKPGALDADLLAAALEDARETFRRAAGALCRGLSPGKAAKVRHVNVETALDWVRVPYPYSPGATSGRAVAALLCGEGQGAKGAAKATRAARARITRFAVMSGSYAEAARALREECGLTPSRETVRKIAVEAGGRTRKALWEGGLGKLPKPRWKPPAGAVRVPATVVAAPDGTCFPCVKADVAGRAGRDGGQAKGRNANVIAIGRYEYVGAGGKPLFPPGSISYFVTGEGGDAFAEKLWAAAEMEGVGEAPRAEYVSDGERELENAYQACLAGLPNMSRALDAMHACGYVDTLVKALEPDAGRAARVSARMRRRLVNAGWGGFADSLARRYGVEATSRLSGDAEKAWNYLAARAAQMDYGRLRRRHLLIGSGMAEAACKLTVGMRLKGPGMHWRFENGILIALLRAVIRSGREIAV